MPYVPFTDGEMSNKQLKNEFSLAELVSSDLYILLNEAQLLLKAANWTIKYTSIK